MPRDITGDREQILTSADLRVVGLCFLVVLLDGFDTAAIGYVAPSLLKEWGIAKPDLAPVLSAALFGLAAGALAAGPVADRFGRRLVLIVSTLLFGAAGLACGFAGSLEQLTVLRFVTGIGLGAELARRQLGLDAMFAVIAVPGLVAAAALLVKRRTAARGED